MDGVEVRQLHDEGDVGVVVVVGASGHVHDGVDHADVLGVGPRSSGVAMTTKLMARSSPNTSYTHCRILRMAFTAATPLTAIRTVSMTRPWSPMGSAT